MSEHDERDDEEAILSIAAQVFGFGGHRGEKETKTEAGAEAGIVPRSNCGEGIGPMHIKQYVLRDVERQAGDGRSFMATLYDASEPDRDHESIDVATVRVRGSIPLQADHNRSVLMTLGRVSNVHAEGDRLRGLLTFAPSGVSANADQVYRQVDAGITTTGSIGFMADALPKPKDGIPTWRDIEVIEFSMVSVPSSPGARVDRAALTKWLGLSDDDEPVLELLDDDDLIEVDDRLYHQALAATARARMNPARLSGMLGERDVFDVDPRELAHIIGATVRAALREVTSNAVQRELNRIRGRVD